MKSKELSTHSYKTLPQLLAILFLFINISTAFSSANNSTAHFGFKGYVASADQQLADLHSSIASPSGTQNFTSLSSEKEKHGASQLVVILKNFKIKTTSRSQSFQHKTFLTGISLTVQEIIFPTHFFW